MKRIEVRVGDLICLASFWRKVELFQGFDFWDRSGDLFQGEICVVLGVLCENGSFDQLVKVLTSRGVVGWTHLEVLRVVHRVKGE